ncbi:ras-interacting protein RIP3-like, partial [Asbolus verrucosus]
WLPLLLCGAVFLSYAEARRVRVQSVPREPDEEESIQYYAAEPQDEEDEERDHRRRVVLVSSADQYNGLYGQPTASSRSVQDNYIPSSRKALAAARAKEQSKSPPVQTIRNYNKVNDDGSFTFGYEAADGSFKEETRGTDCVVRGKYGYIDPDGNKREFTYVSGNPCDPNAPKEPEAQPEQENEPDNGPANYPTRPIRPIRPVTIAPKPITLFQNTYDQSEEEQLEPEQVLKPQQPVRRPSYITRPQYIQQSAADIYQRPQLIPATTPSSTIYKQSLTPINITPRPVSPTPSARTQLPATTYRPQLLQVSVTPRPSLLLAKQLSSPSSTALPSRANVDFDAEFQKFQQENNIVAPTPSTKTASAKTSKPATTSTGSGQVYSSALVFDPTSGQYNTQLYQTLPQTEGGDISLTQRIQPYVHQPQRQVLNLQQLQQQSPLYAQTRPQATQAAYQQQQAGLQFQNSAQLFAQQQRARLQQQQQQARQQQQPVYYIQPSIDQPLASGQIDAFLRGHNVQF